MNSKANLAFSGIPTFCRTPHISTLEETEPDIAVLGVPFDEGVGFRPGARFGPRSIREYSMRFSYFDSTSEDRGYWDMEKRQRFLSHVQMVDLGDVDIVPLDLPYVHRQIDESVKKILRGGSFPVILGGDHSITYPVVRALEEEGLLSLIQLDAHLDRRESLVDSKYGHGSPIRRIGELEFIETIVSLGIRGIRAPEKDFHDAEKRGDVLIPSYTIHQSGVEDTIKRIPNLERCYVTIDIDVLDPSLAPGTGTPEAGGLNYSEVKNILWGLTEKTNVVGFDLVEVNPYLDASGRTSLFAAQLIVEFLGAIFR
jgi:agmatinase